MKVIGTVCRGVGFVGLFFGGLYALILGFTSGIRDALWPWGTLALIGLVLIFIGDKLKKQG